MNDLVASRYAVAGLIGHGVMGRVFRAHDTVLDRPVALKEVSVAGGFELALAEARAAGRINHPNVVTIHDVVDDEGRTLIAMEYLDGPTLDSVLASSGGLAPAQAREVGRRVAASLAAAHTAGIVHRDIKPENVFVLSSGRVVVSDFGLSLSGLQGGTPGYMAPEQWNGQEAIPASDVFAWGCLVAECVTGVPPFGTDPASAQYRTLFEEPDLSGLGGSSEELVRTTLSKAPETRPSDGSMLCELVDRAGPWDGYVPPPAPRSPTESQPSSETSGGLALRVRQPDGTEERVHLAEGQTVELGREAEVTVVDGMVSRRHLRIYSEQGEWVVEDLESLNGTWRNGEPILRGRLYPGDVLAIGSTVIRIEEGA